MVLDDSPWKWVLSPMLVLAVLVVLYWGWREIREDVARVRFVRSGGLEGLSRAERRGFLFRSQLPAVVATVVVLAVVRWLLPWLFG